MPKKYIIITGANSGIGFQAALQASYNKECFVTMICRNKERAEKACNNILKVSNNKNIDYIVADLSSIHTIKNAVNIYKSRYNQLDVLINNAADFDISNKKLVITDNGFDKQFATNVATPYLLSCLFKDYLKDSVNGKIINISSKGLCLFPFMQLDFNNLNGEKNINQLIVIIKISLLCFYFQNILQLIKTL